MYHPGGIDSMGSIPWLLKSFKIPSLATLAESIPGLLEILQIQSLHHAINISVPKAENYNIFNISIVQLIQIQNSTQT